jgi:hypothetical protein
VFPRQFKRIFAQKRSLPLLALVASARATSSQPMQLACCRASRMPGCGSLPKRKGLCGGA